MGFTALIAGGLGAAGSIGSALIGSNAASKASQAQVALGQEALGQQKALFNQGLGLQKGYFDTAQSALNPFIGIGGSAGATLQSLLTPGSGAGQTLAQMPGFAFASQYGTMAARNALSAQGLGASAGPLATAISNYNNGLASTQYFNTVNALQNTFGTGANAASALAGIAGSAGNAALGSGVNSGNAQAGTLQGIGQSQAAGILGQANAWSGGLAGLTGAGGNALTTYGLFNALNGQGSGGLYGNIGNAPATGPGAPNDFQSNMYALSQGINPFSGG